MEAYKVWATLNLKGDAFKKMEQFSKMTKLAAKEINNLNKIANSSSFFNKFNQNLSESSSSLSMVNRKVKDLGRNLDMISMKSKKAGYSYRQFSSNFVHGIAAGAGIGHFRGMGASAGGFAIAAGLSKALHAGSHYQKELALLQLQNIPGLDKATAENYAKNANLPGISRSEALSGLVESATITKNAQEALHIAPFISRMKKSAEALGTQGFSATQTQAALKVGEIVSGSKESKILQKHLDMMFQAWLSSGGRVDPSQYLSIARSSRGNLRGMNPEFFYYGMEPLIQEFGTRIGPQIATFYQHMKSGRLTTQGAKFLGQMGLIKPGYTELDKTGRIKGIKPGGMKDLDLMSKNPMAWLEKYFFPTLQRISKNPYEQQGIIGKIFTNTDLTLVNSIFQQLEKIHQAEAINARTGGVGAAETMIGGIHVGKWNELTKAFNDFFLTLDKFSGPVLDMVASGLTGIFSALTRGLDFLIKINKTFGIFGEENYNRQGRINTISDIFKPVESQSEKEIKVMLMLDGKQVANSVMINIPKLANPNVTYGTSGQNWLWGTSPATNNFSGQ